MKKVLITGGSGLVGSHLIPLLRSEGYHVVLLSRKEREEDGITTAKWDIKEGYVEEKAIEDLYAIIHLAGAGIADERWTDERKKIIIDSRVKSAELLHQKLETQAKKPEVFISASGINYYGSKTTEQVFTETDPPSADFIGRCCVEWEAAADLFSSECRVVKLRTGVVLSGDGGALEKIAKPVKLGVGAPLGSGKQYMPYIHISDLCKMYLHALENTSVSGAYNAVNGDHQTNASLTKSIAKMLKKPLWLPNVPGFAMKLVFGELASILLGGSRASAEKIKETGFEFKYADLKSALSEIYR